MSFSFSPGEGARVTISGEDDLSRLKDKVKGRTEYDNLSERRIVEKVLTDAKYGLKTIATSLLEWPHFAETDGVDESLSDGQSFLDFLQKLAGRLDFEVFIEFANLDKPAAGVEFHFEPARSAQPPLEPTRAQKATSPHGNDQDVPSNVFLLQRERDLLDFKPTIKVIDQYSKVVVKGRHRDRQRPDRVTQPADPEVVKNELHGNPDDPELKPGPTIREKYFPDRPNEYTLSNQTNIDDERAKQMAIAELRKKAREFMTVDGTTIGLPRLRPGLYVEIRGFRPPFDGFYYVTKTVHTFGSDGLRTKFSARRPGMPVPPYTRTKAQ